MANTNCCTCINISGEVETQQYKMTEHASWLMKVISSRGLSFTYLILIGLGLKDQGFKMHSKYWKLPFL